MATESDRRRDRHGFGPVRQSKAPDQEKGPVRHARAGRRGPLSVEHIGGNLAAVLRQFLHRGLVQPDVHFRRTVERAGIAQFVRQLLAVRLESMPSSFIRSTVEFLAFGKAGEIGFDVHFADRDRRGGTARWPGQPREQPERRRPRRRRPSASGLWPKILSLIVLKIDIRGVSLAARLPPAARAPAPAMPQQRIMAVGTFSRPGATGSGPRTGDIARDVPGQHVQRHIAAIDHCLIEIAQVVSGAQFGFARSRWRLISLWPTL